MSELQKGEKRDILSQKLRDFRLSKYLAGIFEMLGIRNLRATKVLEKLKEKKMILKIENTHFSLVLSPLQEYSPETDKTGIRLTWSYR